MKRLPRCEALGRFKVNFVKVYVRGGGLINAHRETNGNPTLYIDLEKSNHGAELHLGIGANFSVSPERTSNVKPHIDIYLPAGEINEFINVLRRAVGG